MSRYDVVEFMSTRVRFESIEQITQRTYAYRPDRPYRWLQRIIFWAARKLKCYHVAKVPHVTRHRIVKPDILDALLAQRRDLLATYDLRGERVLVGPEAHVSLAAIDAPLSFSLPYMKNHEIHGMRVTVVPWMKGILVLPKELPTFPDPGTCYSRDRLGRY